MTPDDLLRAARLFQSHDIDELAEALCDEDEPPRQKLQRLPPRLRVIEGGRR